MNTYKKWIIQFIILNASIFAFATLLVYWVDPLQLFRPTTSYEPTYRYDMRLQTPGLVKSLDYDTLLIGSSTLQNTMTSQADDLFKGQSIKLTIPGASAREHSIFLTQAFRHQKIKCVIQSIDFFSFSGSPDRLRGQPTEHLYNLNLTNANQYLYNGYIIKKIITQTKWSTFFDDKRYKFDMDVFANNSHKHVPSRNATISSFYNEQFTRSFCDKTYLEDAKKNFRVNFLPHAIENPETQFHLFFTPYSILNWVSHHNNQDAQTLFEFRRFLSEACDKLANVTLHDFQHLDKITHNLNNYWDITHYSQAINRQIIYAISQKTHAINAEQCQMNNQLIKQQIQDYLDHELPQIHQAYSKRQHQNQ